MPEAPQLAVPPAFYSVADIEINGMRTGTWQNTQTSLNHHISITHKTNEKYRLTSYSEQNINVSNTMLNPL
jgi:hypothetical protein